MKEDVGGEEREGRKVAEAKVAESERVERRENIFRPTANLHDLIF